MPQIGWIIDLTKCVGCHTCEVACKAENNTYPQMSPLLLKSDFSAVGVRYRRVIEVESGRYPHLKRSFFTMSCFHCEQPACLKACPSGAISKRETDGVVLLDQSMCTGCRYCAAACPYGAPQFNEQTGVMEKCTFCVHRLDEGLEPSCVSGCMGRALSMTVEPNAPGDAPESFADSRLTRPAIEWKRDKVRG